MKTFLTKWKFSLQIYNHKLHQEIFSFILALYFPLKGLCRGILEFVVLVKGPDLGPHTCFQAKWLNIWCFCITAFWGLCLFFDWLAMHAIPTAPKKGLCIVSSLGSSTKALFPSPNDVSTRSLWLHKIFSLSS